LKEISGKEVTTVEGLARGDKLHPLQQAFVDHGALQGSFGVPVRQLLLHEVADMFLKSSSIFYS
jgi:aerobic-type carbon monoxide dehydrogenase small subunit (CoxS/CutS family)